MKKDDYRLLELAKNVLLNKPIMEDENNKWNNIRKGVFITAYYKPEPLSKNVWCCMSNGDYDGKYSVIYNVIQSAKICKTHDSRTKKGQIDENSLFEITILDTRNNWKQVSIDELSNENKAISIASNGKSAIYLPSVWNEYSNWSAQELVMNLLQKADITTNNYTIHTIDVYEIYNQIGGNNKRMEILENIFNFYERYAKKNNDLALAYQIRDNKVSYDNENALVRTLFDLIGYYKVGKMFNKDVDIRVRKQIEVRRNEVNHNNTGELAAWIELLLLYPDENNKEICVILLELLNMETDKGVFSNDLEFANPQALLAIIHATSVILCNITISLDDLYKNFYKVYKSYNSNSNSNEQAFGTNWLTQALIATNLPEVKDFIDKKLVSILRKSYNEKHSITLEIVSAHALIVSNNFDDNDKNELINRLYELQKKFGTGGFQYYDDNSKWFRVDVTTHVAEVLLLL